MFNFGRGKKDRKIFPEFFTLLSVLPAFDIDEKALETAYFREQRRYHPDRFINQPDAERLEAMERSADINRGYETLKDPLKRAQYLLLLQGMFVGTERDSVKPEKALLAEIMEWRERVEEAGSAPELYALSDQLHEMEERLLQDISDSYSKSRWDDMAQQTIKLGYIVKTLGDVRLQLSRKKGNK